MTRYLIPFAVLAACSACAIQAASQTVAWTQAKPVPYFKASDPLHSSVVKTIWECDATSNQWNCNAKPERPQQVTMPVKKSMGAVLPPPEYDKPYTGTLVIVEFDSQDKIRRACPNTKFPEYALGCTIKYPDRCVVFIVNEEEMAKTRFTTKVVLRHERGHCEGWPKDHPNARAPTAAEY